MTDGLQDQRDPAPTDAFAALAAVVLADEALQVRLGGHEHPDEYIADVCRLAAAHGTALDAARVHAATRPDPIGISAFLPSPVTLDRWPGPGWLPARTVYAEAQPAFDWTWFGSAPLDAPFYEDSIRRYAARPFSRMFRTRTTLDAIIRGAVRGAESTPAPAGFIHHMSRCGSTLAAQTFAALPGTIVLSEAEPFDAVVRWAIESGAPQEDQIAALRAIAAALGRDRSGNTRRVIFKLDSWHVLALPLLRAAFPDTPWVYLYRDPLEILVSQQRMRGIHTVAGLLPTAALDIPGAAGMDGTDYAASVLARTGQAVLDHWHVGGGLLVDYAQLPAAIVSAIAPHFGIVPDAADRVAMTAVAMRDAKEPGRPFTPDSAEKRQAASPAVRRAARDIAAPVHARLDTLRRLNDPSQ